MPAVLIAVPSLLVTFLAFVAAIITLALAHTADQWLRPLLVGLADLVPFIGGYLADAAGAVLDFVVEALYSFADGVMQIASAWFDGVGVVVDWLSDGITSIAGETWQALSTLFGVTIPDAVGGVIEWAGDTLDTVSAAVASGFDEAWAGIDAIGSALAGFAEQVWRGIDDLRGSLVEWTEYLLAQGIDRLSWLWDEGLPAIAGDIQNLLDNIKDISADVFGLTQKLDEVLPYIVGLAGAIPLVDAISGIKAASRAEKKLDKLCTLDLDDVDDLLDLAIIIPSLALLIAAVEEAADGLPELLAEIAPSFGE